MPSSSRMQSCMTEHLAFEVTRHCTLFSTTVQTRASTDELLCWGLLKETVGYRECNPNARPGFTQIAWILFPGKTQTHLPTDEAEELERARHATIWVSSHHTNEMNVALKGW